MDFFEIFQPGRAYLEDEKNRQRMDIVQRPAEGPPFGIDLDGGVAYLPRKADKDAVPDADAKNP